MLLNSTITTGATNQQVNLTLSANSWTDALSYIQSINGTVLSMNSTSSNLVLSKPNQTESWVVILKDEELSYPTSYVVFEDSFQNLLTWINAQTGKKVTLISYTQRVYKNI